MGQTTKINVGDRESPAIGRLLVHYANTKISKVLADQCAGSRKLRGGNRVLQTIVQNQKNSKDPERGRGILVIIYLFGV